MLKQATLPISQLTLEPFVTHTLAEPSVRCGVSQGYIIGVLFIYNDISHSTQLRIIYHFDDVSLSDTEPIRVSVYDTLNWFGVN